MKSYYQTPESTFYSMWQNELLVIPMELGHTYYFTETVRAILDFFKTPRSLESLARSFAEPLNEKESHELGLFCEALVQRSILILCESGTDNAEKLSVSYSRPDCLRQERDGGRKLALMLSQAVS